MAYFYGIDVTDDDVQPTYNSEFKEIEGLFQDMILSKILATNKAMSNKPCDNFIESDLSTKEVTVNENIACHECADKIQEHFHDERKCMNEVMDKVIYPEDLETSSECNPLSQMESLKREETRSVNDKTSFLTSLHIGLPVYAVSKISSSCCDGDFKNISREQKSQRAEEISKVLSVIISRIEAMETSNHSHLEFSSPSIMQTEHKIDRAIMSVKNMLNENQSVESTSRTVLSHIVTDTHKKQLLHEMKIHSPHAVKFKEDSQVIGNKSIIIDKASAVKSEASLQKDQIPFVKEKKKEHFFLFIETSNSFVNTSMHKNNSEENAKNGKKVLPLSDSFDESRINDSQVGNVGKSMTGVEDASQKGNHKNEEDQQVPFASLKSFTLPMKMKKPSIDDIDEDMKVFFVIPIVITYEYFISIVILLILLL